MEDRFNLQRFVTAQDGVIDRVLAELRAGRKTSHWMWFVFPQIRGLGFSQMAQLYAISSVEEADAYLAHPVLGQRLVRCARLVLAVEGRSAESILGGVDAAKLRSSMTLFGAVATGETAFGEVLGKYYGGVRDEATLARL
jgi:uncharacterized protein (DUF1810 family)